MGRVQVVTDSTADLDPAVAQELGITVVPLNIHLGKDVLRDGVDVDTPRLVKRMRGVKHLPTTSPPTVREFTDIYGQLVRESDAVLSIHLSSKLSQTVTMAERGALPYIGRKKIVVLDSLSASRGLGYLAISAAQMARDGMPIEELVRTLRTLIPHVYLVFFTETTEPLIRSGRLRLAPAVAGVAPTAKSLLAIEDGELIPLEKVRTRQRAIEKLAEFTLEFPHVRGLTVLHANNEAEVRELIDRIHEQTPAAQIDIAMYGPALATHVGTEAIGMVIFEEAG